MGSKKEYQTFDKVFSKFKYSRPWPAKVIGVEKAKYISKNKYYVFFYGTHNYAKCAPKLLVPYEENKLKLGKKGKKSKCFNRALKEIEDDKGDFGVPLNLSTIFTNMNKSKKSRSRRVNNGNDSNASNTILINNEEYQPRVLLTLLDESVIQKITTSAATSATSSATMPNKNTIMEKSLDQVYRTKGVKKVMSSKMETELENGSFCYLQDTLTGVKYNLLEGEQFVSICNESPSSLLFEQVYKPHCHFIIKFEKRQFNIYRNNISNLSTNVNWTEIKEGKSVELNDRDFITFGKPHNNISYMFCTSLRNIKEPKFVNNKKEDQMIKKIKKLNVELKSFKNKHNTLRKHTETSAAAYQKKIAKDKNIISKLKKSLAEKTFAIDVLMKKKIEYSDELNALKESSKNNIMLLEKSTQALKMNKLDFIENHFCCPICQRVAYRVYSTNCSHIFCLLCIILWMERNYVCPVCRKTVDFLLYSRPLNNCIKSVFEEIGGEIKELREIQTKERSLEELEWDTRRGLQGIMKEELTILTYTPMYSTIFPARADEAVNLRTVVEHIVIQHN